MGEPAATIVWFRQDLRLADNPALSAAAASGRPLIPLYVLDDESAGEWAMGAASRWWLHRSLERLNADLSGHLQVLSGRADEVIPALVRESGAVAVHWNRCYEPWRILRDTTLRERLQRDGIEVKTSNGSYLFEPAAVSKADGSPYRVFTPYYQNGCLKSAPPPRKPVSRPQDLRFAKCSPNAGVDALGLLPEVRWYRGIEAAWQPGEAGASRRLADFLGHGIDGYGKGRDRPDLEHVSRLSPHLHFGEISPHQVWAALEAPNGARAAADEIGHFRRQLGWREFSCYLLYHWPEMTRDNLQRKFNRFPWRRDREALAAWQRGRTGIPIVDAGMRELWQTGYMHNRVRMIAASFLVKNLLLHWHHGEDWFWDTLVDADLANNSASWQWVAGSGADAAPYFRIFNPVTQGRKFDPQGRYVRRYLPELATLPDRYLQAPWEAPPDVLREAGIVLGRDYPQPLVDLKATRQRALDAFRSLTPAD